MLEPEPETIGDVPQQAPRPLAKGGGEASYDFLAMDKLSVAYTQVSGPSAAVVAFGG